MSGLSRICKECKECKFKDNCNSKALETLAYVDETKLAHQPVLLYEDRQYPIGIDRGINIDMTSIQDTIIKSMGVSAKYLQ